MVAFSKNFFIYIQFWKVTFHLQLSQNIGCIPRVVQYILEPVLHPVVCTSHSPPLYWPPPKKSYTSYNFFFSGDVEELEIQEKPALKVFKNISVIQEPGMVVLEVR